MTSKNKIKINKKSIYLHPVLHHPHINSILLLCEEEQNLLQVGNSDSSINQLFHLLTSQIFK